MIKNAGSAKVSFLLIGLLVLSLIIAIFIFYPPKLKTAVETNSNKVLDINNAVTPIASPTAENQKDLLGKLDMMRFADIDSLLKELRDSALKL